MLDFFRSVCFHILFCVQVEIDPMAEKKKTATGFKVMVRTDPKAKVALAAVDSAVYILSKNKLSLQKVTHLGLCFVHI